jgi:electron transport complex protein RnfG
MTPARSLIAAAATLGLFALLGLGTVALVHHGTEDRIEANEQAARLRALETLLPPGSFDNDPLTDVVMVRDPALGTHAPVPVHRARRNGQPVAAVFSPVAPDGYSGAIRLLVAVRADGTLAGVRAVSHRETPGLGDAIDADRSGWIFGFENRSLKNPPESRWAVKRDGGDFDQFAGATVTPRAVVKAVRKTLVFFREHRDRLLYDPPGTAR